MTQTYKVTRRQYTNTPTEWRFLGSQCCYDLYYIKYYASTNHYKFALIWGDHHKESVLIDVPKSCMVSDFDLSKYDIRMKEFIKTNLNKLIPIHFYLVLVAYGMAKAKGYIHE